MFQLCKRIPVIIKYWFILAIAIAGLALMFLVLVQQVIRQSANDPQIQIAGDVAEALVKDKDFKSVIKDDQIDISKSLAPFIIVFNEKGQPIHSNGDLVGKMPTPPDGTFEYARRNGTDKFTWEPKPGIRIAAVLIYQGKNKEMFVLSGRSLREIEKREKMLQNVTLAGTGTILLSTFITAWLFRKSA